MTETQSPTGRKSAFARDWTKGNIFRNLLSLAWPMVVTDGSWAVRMAVDMIWVGRLGAASIAGVGVAGMVVMLAMAARWGLSAGTRAMVARFIGAGDTEGANHVARQAFVISSIYAVVVAVIGVVFAEPIMRLFGLDADVVAEGTAYMRIQFVGSAAMSFWMMGEAIMRASGDAVTPMKVSIIVVVVHLVIDPFLILGWWIFPRLGVSGAATANVIAYSLGVALTLWVLFTGRSRLRLTLSNFRLDLSMIWRVVKIGIPASVMGIQRIFGRLVLVRVMVPFGTLAVAAHTLAQRIEMFIFLPGWAVGMAAGVLVGQNLGAGHPERASRSGWQAVAVVVGFIIICVAGVLLWAEGIISIFSAETGLIEIASAFIRIEAAGYLMAGVIAVLQMCISGAGDTVPPMIASLLMMWVVLIPLAFLLPQSTNLGVYGIRWAIVASSFAGAVAYAIYFYLGRWKRKKV